MVAHKGALFAEAVYSCSGDSELAGDLVGAEVFAVVDVDGAGLVVVGFGEAGPVAEFFPVGWYALKFRIADCGLRIWEAEAEVAAAEAVGVVGVAVDLVFA